jgi:hypothetical protein
MLICSYDGEWTVEGPGNLVPGKFRTFAKALWAARKVYGRYVPYSVYGTGRYA